MLYSEARVGMAVRWDREGYVTKKGKILHVRDMEVYIRWEDGKMGRISWYEKSLPQMTLIDTEEWERAEQFRFFAHTDHGNCPCGIVRSICSYHT